MIPRLYIEYVDSGKHALPFVEGQVVEITTNEFLIGRAQDAHLRLQHPKISRSHAQISYRHDNCFLLDLQSANGTFINAQKLGNEEHRLKNDDRIQLAAVIVFRYEDSYTITDRESDEGEKKSPSPQRAILLKGLWLDPEQHEVYINRRKLEPRLAKNRFTLLQILVEHKGAVVSKQRIADILWPEADDNINPDDALSALVFQLRKQLAPYAAEHDYIVTVPRVGLQFVQNE